MPSRRNVSLMIGLSVPVAMIVLVAASIYLPALWAPQPRTNFLYVTGDNYYGAPRYAVVGGKAAQLEVKTPEHLPHPPPPARLFVYDAAAKTSTEVTLEEAQRLTLDDRDVSPDGYSVRHGSHSDGVFPLFFSGGRDDNTVYLTGHHVSRQLELVTPAENDGYYYYFRMRFLGWIRPGGSNGEK